MGTKFCLLVDELTEPHFDTDQAPNLGRMIGLKQGVDERSSASRTEDNQQSNHSKNQYDGNHPPCFVLLDEQDEFTD